jgi:hypothetical protein
MNLTSTFGSEPGFGELLAAALANGSSLDLAGTTRDMVALLARFRVVDAGAADKAVADARQTLADNNPALQLLERVDQDSRTDNPDLLPFGPVRHVDLGAVERLAMLTQIGFLSDSFLSLFSRGAADFVLSSGGGMPPVIHIASLVQDRLGSSTLNALRWSDEVIPSLLQSSLELTDLVVTGAGGPLPAEWAEAERFLTPWVKSRPTLKPDPDGGGNDDGFLRGNRPGAIHPLVLRILRPKVQTMLASNDPAVVDEATAFSAFLADAAVATDAAVAASPDLFPPASTPGCALVAGAFILDLAGLQGVTLGNDGTVQAPAAAKPWDALADRVLKALIFGAESDLQALPPAWADKGRLKQFLAACPKWGPDTKFGAALRARAQARLGASLSNLGQVLRVQATNLPSDQLLPKAEQIARFAARPKPVQRDVLRELDTATRALTAIQTMSTEAARARREFDLRLANPVAEPTLHRLLPTQDGTNNAVDLTDGAIATYLTLKVARLV